MSIRWRAEREARRLVFEIEGRFTLEEILDVINEAIEHPDFEPGFDVLSDHTGVERPITPNQAHGMVAHSTPGTSRSTPPRAPIDSRTPAGRS